MTIAEATAAEDPRVVAAYLAREMTHARDLDLITLGVLDGDCLELEARGFEAEA